MVVDLLTSAPGGHHVALRDQTIPALVPIAPVRRGPACLPSSTVELCPGLTMHLAKQIRAQALPSGDGRLPNPRNSPSLVLLGHQLIPVSQGTALCSPSGLGP